MGPDGFGGDAAALSARLLTGGLLFSVLTGVTLLIGTTLVRKIRRPPGLKGEQARLSPQDGDA